MEPIAWPMRVDLCAGAQFTYVEGLRLVYEPQDAFRALDEADRELRTRYGRGHQPVVVTDHAQTPLATALESLGSGWS